MDLPPHLLVSLIYFDGTHVLKLMKNVAGRAKEKKALILMF